VWHDAAGEQVDETLIDWSLTEDDDPTTAPEDGLLDPRVLVESETITTSVEWFDSSPADDGLETTRQRAQRERDADSVLAAATQAGAVTEPGEIDHDALAAAQKATESAERRQVKALNKLALAAQEVRREHLRTALARKTLPKGSGAVVARFVATTMWSRHGLLGLNRADSNTRAIATDLLGGDPVELLAEASAKRAQVITAAIVCAAHEADLLKDAWQGSDYSIAKDARALPRLVGRGVRLHPRRRRARRHRRPHRRPGRNQRPTPDTRDVYFLFVPGRTPASRISLM
jgi:ParB family chromosome partitioning protein